MSGDRWGRVMVPTRPDQKPIPSSMVLAFICFLICAAAAGCRKNEGSVEMVNVTDDKEDCAGRIQLIEPEMLRGKKLFTRLPSSALSARIDMAAVGLPSTGAGVELLVTCGVGSGGIWATASVDGLAWDRIEPFGNGLTAFWKDGHAGQRRLVLRPDDGSYRKPDDSEFSIQCDTKDGNVPLQCEVMLRLSDSAYASYVYLAEPGLSRWREIDSLVRQTVVIKEIE